MKSRFVKGHCGWDVVTLLPEGDVPASEELQAAIQIVAAPIDGGLEVGYLGPGNQCGEINLRVVSSTAKDWIAMCGGMTQVIARALIETFFQAHLGIDISQPTVLVKLLTASGQIPLEIALRDGKFAGATTVMDNYLAYLYRKGIEPMLLEGAHVLRVGTYAVMDMEALEKLHPGVDFTRRDLGPHLEIVNTILRAFEKYQVTRGVTGMMYDARPEGVGEFRAFPRFYSEDLAAARILWEFQCGTGSVAVAMALAHESRLPFAGDCGSIILEWGSYRTTRDPYGIRTSRIDVERLGRRLTRASFNHSVVEIIAEGTLTLPEFLHVRS